MSTKDQNSRRDKILGMIVDTYVSTAEPIASRAISKKLRLGLSSATIRNVMSDLEEMGFITHPHTSAGRIPTSKGYRYYIDRLMRAALLTEEEKRNINRIFKSRVNDLSDMLDKTSHILSIITSQTGVVLFPLLQKSPFKHVEFIKLDIKKILIILITESGLTQDFAVNIDEDIEESDLMRISKFINSNIGKGSLASIRKEITQRLLTERDSLFYILEKAKIIIDIMLDIIKENKVYLDGTLHMTEQPEFRDVNKLKSLLGKLEDRDFIFALLKRSLDNEGARVYIGSELSNDFSDCSLITCNYCIGDTSCGSLGIIGPTRMEYAKLITMVDYVATTLTERLNAI